MLLLLLLLPRPLVVASLYGWIHTFVRFLLPPPPPLRSLRESLAPELYVIGQTGTRHMFFFLYSCCRKKAFLPMIRCSYR